jgi:hypothetical protein
MNKKLIREMRFMMERLESPRMTDTELRSRRKAIKESIRESRKRILKEDSDDLIKRLKAIFPKLDVFIEDGYVCVTQQIIYDQDGELTFKTGLSIDFGDEDEFLVGNFEEQYSNGKLQASDLYTNDSLTFDELVEEMRTTLNKGGSPYKETDYDD